MTSLPSQQCAKGVECAADCCTPPRLCVISCSMTVGCQSHELGVVERGVSIIPVRPPSLAKLPLPAVSSGETSAMPQTPLTPSSWTGSGSSAVRPSARMNTSRAVVSTTFATSSATA